mmetsp:Transcript_44288/g.103874  ORF Transcript_44288/g.103874 Transcript_44288/m.103874 type:complete len:508 (-) Transcript_44288:497-2020(-)
MSAARLHTAGSAKSMSAGGAKYKSKGASMVDESLFGSQTAKARATQGVSIVSKSMLASALGNTAAVLAATDVDRMRASSQIKGWDEEREAMRLAAETLAERKAKANARKEYMIKQEEERKRNVPLTDLEKADIIKRGAMLSNAALHLAEGIDDVKQMNQMVALAKTMTIRDMQLDEKKEGEFLRLHEERRLDELAESERLKALAMYDTRDVKRSKDRQYGAEVLKRQMADRERMRLRELGMQDKERDAMAKQMSSLKADEVVAQAERREQNRRLLEEVALANAEQIRTKNRLAAAEKEDERRIMAYNKAKDERERAEVSAKERIRIEKEAEMERMRAAQQKMQDVQSGIDALRMRRADEEKEREWRRKEKAEAERQLAVQSQLSDAREYQREEKERRMIEATLLDREEFDYTLRVQAEQQMRDEMAHSQVKAAQLAYKEELQSQIVMNAVARKENRLQFLNEGRSTAAESLAEKAKLETIKARKLAELKTAGVADKYLVDLMKKTFT